MKFSVLTLFPEVFNSINSSITGKAIEKELIQLELINIRDFSKDKHKKVDDTPYGGGPGMVIMPDVVYDAYKSIKKSTKKTRTIYLSPQGNLLNQNKVKELSKYEHLILIAGHYEGIDQRVIDKIVDEEISIGDYILTGGELPSMVLIDSITRYVEGVLNKESIQEESFTNNILEYPQYTRPETFFKKRVPDVLLSGNHANINEWRRNKSLENTYFKRPELLENVELSKKDQEFLKNLKIKDRRKNNGHY